MHAEPAGPSAPAPPAPRRRGPPPRTVLAIASLGAAMAFVDATIVNIAFPDIARSFPERVDRDLVVGPQRLQHRVRGVPGRGGAAGGPRRPAARCSSGASRCSRSPPRCARSRSVARRADRLARPPGARRRDAGPLLAGARAGRVPPEHRAHGVALLVGRRRARPPGSARRSAGCWWPPATGGSCSSSTCPIGVAAIILTRRHLVESRAPGRRRMPDLLGAARVRAGDRGARARRRQGRGVGLAQRRASSASFAVAVALGARRSSGAALTHRAPIIDLSLLRDPGVRRRQRR